MWFATCCVLNVCHSQARTSTKEEQGELRAAPTSACCGGMPRRLDVMVQLLRLPQQTPGSTGYLRM